MAITINEEIIEEKRILAGGDSFTLASGEFLKIESTGAESLNDVVPAGKKWQVVYTLRIEESDS